MTKVRWHPHRWPLTLTSALILGAVREAGVGFADQGIVSEEIIHVISDDAPWGGATGLSPPHEGALKHYAQVVLKLEKDAGKGWSSGGWRLPFWPIRANPYSIDSGSDVGSDGEVPDGH